MTSKAEQLFLEICLLRIRYSAADIQRVASTREVMNDPELQNLITAVKNLQLAPQVPKKGRDKPKRVGPARRTSAADVKRAIVFFIDRVSDKRLLRAGEQLEKFALSIGIIQPVSDRMELISSIKKRLEIMPAEQAMQRMRSVDSEFRSDSAPYLDLAKTLMRS
jgi:hypothetical protein